MVLAEEQNPIQVKGFAKPVRNYKVLEQFDKLLSQSRVIREEQDGLRVFLDLDKASAVQALKSILARLGS